MRNTFCTLSIVCILVFGNAINGEAAEVKGDGNQTQTQKEQVSQSGATDLHEWLKSIKPAAGSNNPSKLSEKNYWETRVKRNFRINASE